MRYLRTLGEKIGISAPKVSTKKEVLSNEEKPRVVMLMEQRPANADEITLYQLTVRPVRQVEAKEVPELLKNLSPVMADYMDEYAPYEGSSGVRIPVGDGQVIDPARSWGFHLLGFWGKDNAQFLAWRGSVEDTAELVRAINDPKNPHNRGLLK